MRVGIIGMHFAPEPSGNAPYTAGLAAGLAQRGHDVRVLTGVPHYPEWRVAEGYGQWSSQSWESGAAIRRLLHYVPSRPTPVRRMLMELSFGIRVASQSGHEWPDVVVSVTPALFSTALAIARLRSIRPRPATGLWVQDLYSAGLVETGVGRGPSAGAVQRVESAVARGVDGVAVIHERFRARLVSQLGVPADRVTVIRNWTHLSPAGPVDVDSLRKRFGWAPTEVVVLHAGNMGVKQGLENVVEAARLADVRSASVRFVLVGGGNQLSHLKEISAGVERLDFLPSLPDSDYQAILKAADILLVNEKPGVSEMSVPSKLTSYFTTNRPVLGACDPMGATAGEIRMSGAGVCVPPGDPNALLLQAVELGKDPERRSRMGVAGLDYQRERLSREAAMNDFESWLEKLIAARRARAES